MEMTRLVTKLYHCIFHFIIGAILGSVSGIVGIGGGIFLGPILYLFRAANPKHITTAVSLFILINSLSGIVGQLTKNQNVIEVKEYFFLLLAVFIGGQLGNLLNLKLLSTKTLALITSLLVIFVAIRMGFNIFNF
jgi:Sulfite exporter TauE/SafE.